MESREPATAWDLAFFMGGAAKGEGAAPSPEEEEEEEGPVVEALVAKRLVG